MHQLVPGFDSDRVFCGDRKFAAYSQIDFGV